MSVNIFTDINQLILKLIGQISTKDYFQWDDCGNLHILTTATVIKNVHVLTCIPEIPVDHYT